MRLDDVPVREEASVFLSRLHHECEGGEGGGARVEFEAVEVVLEYLGGNFRGVVAAFRVDVEEDIEGVDQGMS